MAIQKGSLLAVAAVGLLVCLVPAKASQVNCWTNPTLCQIVDVSLSYPEEIKVKEGLRGSESSRKLLQASPDEALWEASMNGDNKAAKKALKEGANTGFADEDGVTPLFLAAAAGHFKVVQTLIQEGAQVDAARITDGATPLFEAALFGHSNIVKKLIDNGASVDVARSSDGATPLIVAPVTLGFDSELMVKDLLEAGAELELRNLDGWTALYSSAYWGNLETLKIFLLKGADPRAPDNNGNTPHDIICECAKHNEEFQQCDVGGCDRPRVVEQIGKLLSEFNSTETSPEGNNNKKRKMKLPECGHTSTDETAVECILGITP